MAIGEKSAKELLAFVANPASKPAAVTDAQWAEARTKQLEPLANATLVFVAMYPGNQAVAKKEFPAAEQSFRKALQQYPENGWIAYNLGSAIMNEKDPAKISEALYYIARGAAMDPAKGGIADEKIRSTIDAYLKKVYSNYHGSDEGVDQLKQQALASPNPPADFKIKTATDIANEKQQQFAAQYPQLALWMGIKSQLTAPEGESYFATQLKEAAVPKLKGTVMGGKPECRSKEILVAVPEPNQTSTLTAEIALKLDTPLTRQAGGRNRDSVGRRTVGFQQGPVPADHGRRESQNRRFENRAVRGGPRQEGCAGEEGSPKEEVSVGGTGRQLRRSGAVRRAAGSAVFESARSSPKTARSSGLREFPPRLRFST